MDVTAVDATLSLDCRVRLARGEAVVHFTVGDDDAPSVFDLRQEVTAAVLDGSRVDVDVLALGDDGVRRLPEGLGDGPHELHLSYELDVPGAVDAMGVGWTANAPGVVFDLWMSDLHPGRYLESWIPAPLCHDRFALRIDLDLAGTTSSHAVFANGRYSSEGVAYPDSGTSLSPMLVIAPESRVELVDSGGITVFKLAGPEVDLDAAHAQVRALLEENRDTFGEYVFGERFLAYLWGTTRGMEYDGATTSSVGALEHEVFHSWFGRGVKPACANDGWIDEAFTTWWTAGPPRQRRWAEPFDWSEPPVVLRPPGALDRFTPREAYTAGARLFAGLADALGGVEALVAAMARMYGERAGGFVSTDELCVALGGGSGGSVVDIAFERWVHGKDVRP